MKIQCSAWTIRRFQFQRERLLVYLHVAFSRFLIGEQGLIILRKTVSPKTGRKKLVSQLNKSQPSSYYQDSVYNEPNVSAFTSKY